MVLVELKVDMKKLPKKFKPGRVEFGKEEDKGEVQTWSSPPPRSSTRRPACCPAGAGGRSPGDRHRHYQDHHDEVSGGE